MQHRRFGAVRDGERILFLINKLFAGLVVSVLYFYSDDPSLSSAEAYRFFRKMLFEKNKSKQIETGECPLKIATS